MRYKVQRYYSSFCSYEVEAPNENKEKPEKFIKKSHI